MDMIQPTPGADRGVPLAPPPPRQLRPVVESRSGAWTIRTIRPFHGGPALRSIAVGDSLTISLDRQAGVSLVLLRHPWSGRAEVISGDHVGLHELFSKSTTLLDIPLAIGSAGLVRLCNRGRSHPEAQGNECWLVGFRQHGMLWPVELGEPISRATRLIRGRVGDFLTFRHDIGIADSLALHGVWGDDEVRRFAEYVRPGMTAVDVGANFGHHAIALSRLVGATGRVLAFEPQRQVHHLLCANIAINGAWNVAALRRALGDTVGSARMRAFDYDRGGNVGALGIAPDHSDPARLGEEVELSTLDAEVERHLGQTQVNFIKIDVQSFELFVLRGSRTVLTQHRPIVQVEISPLWMRKRGYDHREIRGLLESHGYRCTDLIAGRESAVAEFVWDGATDMEWNMLALPDR